MGHCIPWPIYVRPDAAREAWKRTTLTNSTSNATRVIISPAGLRGEPNTAATVTARGSSRLYEIRGDNSSVEIWLHRRLPFEPKGEMRSARDDLQKALQRLVCPSGLVLAATYSSADCSFCDVENILFYNVGSGAFAGIARRGLRFERTQGIPTTPDGRAFSYYQRYYFLETPKQPTRQAAASFEFAIDGISTSTKPHSVWWPAAGAHSTVPPAPVHSAFELYVELGAPKVQNASSIVKQVKKEI
jgi:hypothetical protein